MSCERCVFALAASRPHPIPSRAPLRRFAGFTSAGSALNQRPLSRVHCAYAHHRIESSIGSCLASPQHAACVCVQIEHILVQQAMCLITLITIDSAFLQVACLPTCVRNVTAWPMADAKICPPARLKTGCYCTSRQWRPERGLS